LYVTLWSKGLISDEELSTFGMDGTCLPGHPSGSGIPGLSFPTGSLGHGLPLAAGLALAGKYKKTERRVYCLCSDGEWQEGSCWEALIFLLKHRLDNLTVLIDVNGLQAFGTTEEVAGMSGLGGRISSFGADVVTVNGHDEDEIRGALRGTVPGKPYFVLLQTVKGKGTFFQDKIESHYLPLTKEQYDEACETAS
jgi:transketolase